MPPKEGAMPPGVGAIIGIIWLLFMGGMIVGYVIMLIVWWRAMKAHEKIADKLNQIADKLQAK
jgi:uncharacterized membrane protein YciS (DUF1049 family)